MGSSAASTSLRSTAILATTGAALTFRLLCYPAHVRRFLARATEVFRLKHPGTSIVFLGLADEIRAGGGGELLARLVQGEAELAIAPSGTPLAGPFATQPLYDWKLVAGLREPTKAGRLPVAALDGANLLLSPPRFHSRELVTAACVRAGFEPRVVAESSNTEVLIALGEHGAGIPILPDDAVVAANSLTWLPLVDSQSKPLEGAFSLYTRKLDRRGNSQARADGATQLEELSEIIVSEAGGPGRRRRKPPSPATRRT